MRRLTALLVLPLVVACGGPDDSPRDGATTRPTAPSNPEPAAIDVAEEVGLGGVLGYGRGVSIVDLDGDGWQDVLLADSDGRMRGDDFGVTSVHRNVGGRFEPWDIGLSPDHLYATAGGVFGDADGDGDPDLLVVNGNNTARSRLAFYENRLDAEQRFVESTASRGIPTGDEAWWGGAWLDVDSDGDLDLIVTGSRTVLLVNDGEGSFRDETTERGLSAWVNDPIHKNPVVVDIDGDGHPDLASGGGSPAVLFRNDGSGRFVDVTDSALPDDLPANWWVAGFAAAAADFNQDGHEDLYFGRFWYQDQLLLNRGDGTFTAHSTDLGIETIVYDESTPFFGGQVPVPADRSTSPTTPTTWQWIGDYTTGSSESENTMGLTVGDLDDDGSPDIVIGTGDPSSANLDIVFCGDAPGDGSVRFTRCREDLTRAQGPTRGHGIAIADLDHDGSTDLLTNPGGWTAFDAATGTDTRERPHVYLGTPADGPDPAAVRLVTDGRDAIGARLTVLGPTPRYRTLYSNQGFQSMSSWWTPVPTEDPVTVEVRWPGGRTTEHRVEPGSRTTIEEPRP